mmetsp:Transcript_18239/g.46331  ORF Transcript_18239/g.46331 Transcript_18239/m.46331 type:complete len:331 (+) Transcript_18239:1119-2111(+)
MTAGFFGDVALGVWGELLGEPSPITGRGRLGMASLSRELRGRQGGGAAGCLRVRSSPAPRLLPSGTPFAGMPGPAAQAGVGGADNVRPAGCRRAGPGACASPGSPRVSFTHALNALIMPCTRPFIVGATARYDMTRISVRCTSSWAGVVGLAICLRISLSASWSISSSSSFSHARLPLPAWDLSWVGSALASRLPSSLLSPQSGGALPVWSAPVDSPGSTRPCCCTTFSSLVCTSLRMLRTSSISVPFAASAIMRCSCKRLALSDCLFFRNEAMGQIRGLWLAPTFLKMLLPLPLPASGGVSAMKSNREGTRSHAARSPQHEKWLFCGAG